jgi:hypothetical protein
MGVADRLRRLDNHVLGRPKPITSRTQRNSFLVGFVGTVALLSYSSFSGSTGVLAGSGGFFGVMVASGLRWFRALERHGKWQARDGARRVAAGAGLLLVALVVGWYGFLFARGDDAPRYSREQCEVVRDGFLERDSGGVIDEILRECAKEGR